MDWRAFGLCQVRELAKQGWIDILENRKIVHGFLWKDSHKKFPLLNVDECAKRIVIN